MRLWLWLIDYQMPILATGNEPLLSQPIFTNLLGYCRFFWLPDLSEDIFMVTINDFDVIRINHKCQLKDGILRPSDLRAAARAAEE